MTSPSPLRALLIEDSINDTFLIVRELQRAGMDVEFERVETAAYLRAALREQRWDLIICDWCLPQFDGKSALALYQHERLDIPFIMVSGRMGEEHALAMMRAGAHDYVSKDNLARLAPAVLRELRAAKERRALMEAGNSALNSTPDARLGTSGFSPALSAKEPGGEPGFKQVE